MSYLYREDLVLLCIPVWRSMWPFNGLLLGKKKVVFNLTSQPQGEIQAKSSFHSDERSIYSLWSSESCPTALHTDDLNFTSPIELVHTTWGVEWGTSSLEHVSGRHTNSNVLSKLPPKQLVNGLAFQEKSVFHAWRVSPGGAISALLVFVLRAIWGQIVLSTHAAPVIACELRWVK